MRVDGEPERSLSAVSDKILVARAIDQDTVAFAELVRRHSPLVRAYVARITGSLSEADDVVQEAFMTAWRQLSTLRDHAAVKAWLMRIASREAFAHIKRRGYDDSLESINPLHSPELQPDRVAMYRAELRDLSAALDALPDDQRRCWMLREIAELSYAEIAGELEMSPAAVRGALARARASIAIRMEGWR